MTARIFILALLAFGAGLLFYACDNGGEETVNFPPPAPTGLWSPSRTDTTITLQWHDASNNELGFIVYWKVSGQWVVRDTVGSNITGLVIVQLQPDTPYHFRVTAYNEYGESAASGEIAVRTATPDLPTPPTEIYAVALASTLVEVRWNDNGTQDSFLISRREPAAAWITVGATPDNIEVFNDTTVQTETTYFYRVGSKNYYGVAWSVDSVTLTTPPPGPPAPPDSVNAAAILGIGVVLQWVDRSTDETLFEIGRGLIGQSLTIIDSVPANTTTYTDSLGDQVGNFYYAVRARNENGPSLWTVSNEIEYRFCSNGIIPICLGNYWLYRVDSTGGADYNSRHGIDFVAFPDGLDYYLMTVSGPVGTPDDSLFYLRNVPQAGCKILPHPLPATPDPQLLFCYPVTPAGTFYRCEGDCVLVVSTSMTRRVNDVDYTGVVAIERFFDPQKRVIYYIKPGTIGIIQEVEYHGPISLPVEVCRRNLIEYQVRN